MMESEKVQRCIDIGMSVRICIPGKIDFTIDHRPIPGDEGEKPHKPILWKNAKQYVNHPTWLKVRGEMQIAIDEWWVRRNKRIAEQKIVRKLVKIKKMVLRLEAII